MLQRPADKPESTERHQAEKTLAANQGLTYDSSADPSALKDMQTAQRLRDAVARVNASPSFRIRTKSNLRTKTSLIGHQSTEPQTTINLLQHNSQKIRFTKPQKVINLIEHAAGTDGNASKPETIGSSRASRLRQADGENPYQYQNC